MNAKRVQKTKLTASTPSTSAPTRTNIASDNLQTLSDSFEIEFPASVKPLSKAKKAPMLDLICEAIKVTGVPRKGASFINIKKWILNGSESMTSGHLIASLKRAFKMGLEKGVLGRPSRCKDYNGLIGSFVVLQKISPKKENPKKKEAKARGKPKGDVNKTKKAKPVSNAKAASPKTASPVRRLKLPTKESKRLKEPNAASKKSRKSKVLAVKTLNSKASKIAAKRESGVSVHSTTKTKLTKAPTKKKLFSSASKIAAKRTSGELARNTSKTNLPEVKTKKTPKVKRRAGEAKGASKRTKAVKPMPVSKAEEASSSTGEDLQAVPEVQSRKPEKKTVGAKVQSKETKPKKLFSDLMAPTTNLSRKDLSDTELEVKPKGRKSLKSYSSDTDINAIGSEQNNVKKMKKLKLKKLMRT